jgi:signal transduction histidine kinase
MANVPLQEFVAAHRDEIILRCRGYVATRSIPPSTEWQMDHGVPLFLDQLVHTLSLGLSADPEIGRSAGLHGHELLLRQCSVRHVVQNYGDICQAIASLAVELDAPIGTNDFRTLNRCLDDAIAGAVTQYGDERSQSDVEGESVRGSERLGFLAHELGNLTQTALLAFAALKAVQGGAAGSTAGVLHRSLVGIRALIGSSLAEVRLTNGLPNRERFLVSGLIQDVASAAALEANTRGIILAVMPVESDAEVEADRPMIAAAVGNLLQNAFKFTQPRSTVTLRVGASAARVLIEVQDACGGLPAGNIKDLFRPFEQRSADRTGLGLGLAFSKRGVEANGGEISAHNLPHHQGCVFTIDLPRVPVRDVAMV